VLSLHPQHAVDAAVMMACAVLRDSRKKVVRNTVAEAATPHASSEKARAGTWALHSAGPEFGSQLWADLNNWR
jgi:hypothetical protein